CCFGPRMGLVRGLGVPPACCFSEWSAIIPLLHQLHADDEPGIVLLATQNRSQGGNLDLDVPVLHRLQPVRGELGHALQVEADPFSHSPHPSPRCDGWPLRWSEPGRSAPSSPTYRAPVAPSGNALRISPVATARCALARRGGPCRRLPARASVAAPASVAR